MLIRPGYDSRNIELLLVDWVQYKDVVHALLSVSGQMTNHVLPNVLVSRDIFMTGFIR
jgi:hypothetical protein